MGLKTHLGYSRWESRPVFGTHDWSCDVSWGITSVFEAHDKLFQFLNRQKTFWAAQDQFRSGHDFPRRSSNCPDGSQDYSPRSQHLSCQLSANYPKNCKSLSHGSREVQFVTVKMRITFTLLIIKFGYFFQIRPTQINYRHAWKALKLKLAHDVHEYCLVSLRKLERCWSFCASLSTAFMYSKHQHSQG